MAQEWLDTVIVSLIVIIGIFLFYKALREPIDLLFSKIKDGFAWAGNKMSGSGSSGSIKEVIVYE